MTRVVLIIEFEISDDSQISEILGPVLIAANKTEQTIQASVTRDARDLVDIDLIKSRIKRG